MSVPASMHLLRLKEPQQIEKTYKCRIQPNVCGTHHAKQYSVCENAAVVVPALGTFMSVAASMNLQELMEPKQIGKM